MSIDNSNNIKTFELVKKRLTKENIGLAGLRLKS